MRSLTPVLAFFVFCSPARAADDALTAEKAKALIPEAAGIPRAELATIGEELKGVRKFYPSNGDSLTYVLLFTDIPRLTDPKNPTSFRLPEGTPDPLKIVRAIGGPKDKDGKYRKYASLIQPEYITDCTCKVDGDAATGTVTFKADKAYEGKAEYTARKKAGAWRIEEFRVPDLKITTALGADGKWVKK
jgi:hypothetical protein